MEKKKHCEREASIGSLPRMPRPGTGACTRIIRIVWWTGGCTRPHLGQGSNLKPGYVPWPGIKPTVFWLWDNAPTNQAKPARIILFFKRVVNPHSLPCVLFCVLETGFYPCLFDFWLWLCNPFSQWNISGYDLCHVSTEWQQASLDSASSFALSSLSWKWQIPRRTALSAWAIEQNIMEIRDATDIIWERNMCHCRPLKFMGYLLNSKYESYNSSFLQNVKIF